MTRWNETSRLCPYTNKTIHEMFEEQVIRTPDNIALVYEDKRLTYKELNEKANQLAYYLRETYQINSDDLIALYLDRSEYMLIAILATLKSGAAYVPLTPSYPEERVKYILQDTKAKILLISEFYHPKKEKHSRTFRLYLSANDNIINPSDFNDICNKSLGITRETLIEKLNLDLR